MVLISGNHVHAFHTIWPPYLLQTLPLLERMVIHCDFIRIVCLFVLSIVKIIFVLSIVKRAPSRCFGAYNFLAFVCIGVPYNLENDEKINCKMFEEGKMKAWISMELANLFCTIREEETAKSLSS